METIVVTIVVTGDPWGDPGVELPTQEGEGGAQDGGGGGRLRGPRLQRRAEGQARRDSGPGEKTHSSSRVKSLANKGIFDEPHNSNVN